MTIERTHAGITISDIVDGFYFARRYIGYTPKHAKKQFAQDMRNEMEGRK